MSAAMAEVLEPQGLGHELLTEWGLWYRDDRDGRESWSAKPRVDPGYHGDPPERVRIVDKIIARHRLKYHDDWRVVAQYYMDDRQPWEIAKRMKWSEHRVRAMLLMVGGMVEREYRDWKDVNK